MAQQTASNLVYRPDPSRVWRGVSLGGRFAPQTYAKKIFSFVLLGTWTPTATARVRWGGGGRRTPRPTDGLGARPRVDRDVVSDRPVCAVDPGGLVCHRSRRTPQLPRGRRHGTGTVASKAHPRYLALTLRKTSRGGHLYLATIGTC